MEALLKQLLARLRADLKTGDINIPDIEELIKFTIYYYALWSDYEDQIRELLKSENDSAEG